MKHVLDVWFQGRNQIPWSSPQDPKDLDQVYYYLILVLSSYHYLPTRTSGKLLNVDALEIRNDFMADCQCMRSTLENLHCLTENLSRELFTCRCKHMVHCRLYRERRSTHEAARRLILGLECVIDCTPTTTCKRKLVT